MLTKMNIYYEMKNKRHLSMYLDVRTSELTNRPTPLERCDKKRYNQMQNINSP